MEELNLADNDNEPKTIAKEIELANKGKLTDLLRKYKDVLALSFEDIRGFDPRFCRHQINLHRDARLVQQCRYKLNLNYGVKV